MVKFVHTCHRVNLKINQITYVWLWWIVCKYIWDCAVSKRDDAIKLVESRWNFVHVYACVYAVRWSLHALQKGDRLFNGWGNVKR